MAAQGAGDETVVNEITYAVQVLFDVPVHKIKSSKNEQQVGRVFETAFQEKSDYYYSTGNYDRDCRLSEFYRGSDKTG